MLAPSLLAIWDKTHNLAACTQAALAAQQAGADELHLDIMDGRFVPATTFGPEMLTALRQNGVTLPLDVHLMTLEPEKSIEDYIKAGTTSLTFHPSSTNNPAALLASLKNRKIRAGLALDITEDTTYLTSVLPLLDQVLVMTVKAGAGGQPFQLTMLEKIRAVRTLVPPTTRIVADGGINPQTAPLAYNAGADMLVAGSAVFNSPNLPQALQSLRR